MVKWENFRTFIVDYQSLKGNMKNSNPLDQLRQICLAALSGASKVRKSFVTFFIDTMILYLTIPNRINFLQMARFGNSCESRYRQNFGKQFDWFGFNLHFASRMLGHRIAIALDASFISKSGKCTPGISYFWSGCARAMKRGLEILAFALVDADEMDAVFLGARQTFLEPIRGRKPKYLKHMDNDNSLIGKYLRAIAENRENMLRVSSLLVADAYFSVSPFVKGVRELGFHLISRLRNDVSLRYIYTGERTGKRGAPKKYDGKVNLEALRDDIFKTDKVCLDNGKIVTLHHAIVNAKALKENILVVIAIFHDPVRKTQVRKVFFSTDIMMKARDVFDLYRARFQEEFLFREAKVFTGLQHCQARSKEKLDFAFNASLSAVNMARSLAIEMEKKTGKRLSVAAIKVMLNNVALYERIRFFAGSAETHRHHIKYDTIFEIPEDILMFGVINAA